MRIFSTTLLLAEALVRLSGVAALSAAEWRRQSVYQVVTDRFARTDLSTTAPCDTSEQVYCGGTWRGLISKLDYIQGMGFTAVWISPIVKQIDGNSRDGSSYHGYWAEDIWAVNQAFGTSDDLAELSDALHARGMYLMVDIVTNHMAYMGCGSCVDYNSFKPFSSSSYFHTYCPIDYESQTSVEECWQGSNIVSLPDLRTEDESVRRIWNEWISELVKTYSIDGLRIDSVKHVEPSFWPGFSAAAGVYMVGEVFHGDPLYIVPYQQHMDGLMDYPSYYWTLRAFQSPSGSFSELADGINTLRGAASDLSLYGSFLENHDVERFASFTRDMAIAFTMLKDGIPIIYQGQEQHYAGKGTPHNREAVWFSGYSTSSELYTWIAKLNQIRAQAINDDADYLTYSSQPIPSGDQAIAMRKGHVVGVFTNVGSSSSVSVTLASSATGFEANQHLVDVMSCSSYTADAGGSITLTLTDGLPRVLYPRARLTDGGICPELSGTATPSSGPTATTTSSINPACSLTAADITFNGLVATIFGETIKVQTNRRTCYSTGNIPALGNWNPSNAVTLNASRYTQDNPLWIGTVSLPPGTVVEYKFIKVSSSGSVTWEAGPNRTYTVPCTTATVGNTWQG
ncbi:Alpha-amylase A type-1/2 [Madurella mycetomatis]|uniref:alpha-amylase n=1 Tax=Madurella mycetomatis TaxID=100816 RepID=A0A175W7Z8_9PEZI|nr:Alpha-amylase A type-1/2 [Madurella mycetomatis]